MKLKDAIKNNLSSDIASHEAHCMDNEFIDIELDSTELNMIRRGYEPIGICTPSFVSYRKNDFALVYEDSSFEKHWCHITENLLNSWLRDLNKTHERK